MSSSRDRILFWCLLAAQAAGSQVIIWGGVPLYRRLQSGVNVGATPKEIILILAAIVIMQSAHWIALPLGQRLRFRRNVVLDHVLIWIGELSLFFAAAISTVILFERLNELNITLWRLFVLAATLFAVSSYKSQLMSLGDAMIKVETGAEDQTNPSSSETPDAPSKP
ncbi:MAG: hypothetical protein ACREOP_15905 [Thermodesulfobacteriota bacterium]